MTTFTREIRLRGVWDRVPDGADADQIMAAARRTVIHLDRLRIVDDEWFDRVRENFTDVSDDVVRIDVAALQYAIDELLDWADDRGVWIS